MKKKHFLFFTSAMFLFDCNAVTFEEAVIGAYNNNKKWLSAQIEKKIQDEKLISKKMTFLPSIEGQLRTSRTKSEISKTEGNPTTQEKVHSRDSSKQTNTELVLNVKQNLFNGFSTINSTRAQENRTNAAFHGLKQYEQEKLIAEVLKAYLGVWISLQKVTAYREKENNLHKSLEAMKNMLLAGTKTRAQVAEMNANYQKAIYERIAAETELSTEKSEFEKLTGIKAENNFKLPDLNFEMPENAEKLIAIAMSKNHSILNSRFTEDAAQNELNSARGALSPSCDLAVSAARSLKKQRYNNSQNEYTASLNVTIPIFHNDGSNGNSYSAIKMADQTALKAKIDKEDTILDIKKQCIDNWNKSVSAEAQIKASREGVRSAELTSESNQEESIMGTKSSTEILSAENNLLDTRIDYAKARAQKVLACYGILVLCGAGDLNSLLCKNHRPKRRGK
ncbi:MAG: TolC family protein [Holosporaceae bacterium]|jgi:outer membrane protein TolC|nr:TolC family protein [Holosporaceae bacterium]